MERHVFSLSGGKYFIAGGKFSMHGGKWGVRIVFLDGRAEFLYC